MRRRVTLLFLHAAGTKLPNLLIFKRQTLPKDVIPHGIYVHVRSKGQLDGWRRNETVVGESVVQVVFLKNHVY
jgi:hypothetical protein